jgi:hypothetical protein
MTRRSLNMWLEEESGENPELPRNGNKALPLSPVY